MTEFEGIGPKKAERLLKSFKTKTVLKQATAAELAEAAGISSEKAKKLQEFIQTI